MKVFVTRPIPEAGLELLRQAGHTVVVNQAAKDRPATREELLAGVVDCTAILSVLTEKIDAAVMTAAGSKLKVIANYAVGYDNIDLVAAKARGILVTNTPDVLSSTVAEHTVALLLAIAHRISEGERLVRAGQYFAWGPE